MISAPDPDVWFTHGYTYSGHPVACAVGCSNIEIIEREDLCGNAARVGDYLEKRLATLRDLPIVGDVRGHRLMMCVEYVQDKKTREKLPDSVNISKPHLHRLRGPGTARPPHRPPRRPVAAVDHDGQGCRLHRRYPAPLDREGHGGTQGGRDHLEVKQVDVLGPVDLVDLGADPPYTEFPCQRERCLVAGRDRQP